MIPDCAKKIFGGCAASGTLCRSLQTLLRFRYGLDPEVFPLKKSHLVWPILLSPKKSLRHFEDYEIAPYMRGSEVLKTLLIKAVGQSNGLQLPGVGACACLRPGKLVAIQVKRHANSGFRHGKRSNSYRSTHVVAASTESPVRHSRRIRRAFGIFHFNAHQILTNDC
jgi:hypothetical protein